MIELFNTIKNKREKRITIQCSKVPHWSSLTEKITELVDYIDKNMDNFYVELFEIEYGLIIDEVYVSSFNIDVRTDKETYKYIATHYKRILDKYDKYRIELTDIKFHALSNNHKLKL